MKMKKQQEIHQRANLKRHLPNSDICISTFTHNLSNVTNSKLVTTRAAGAFETLRIKSGGEKWGFESLNLKSFQS